MAVRNAQIVDLGAYRAARQKPSPAAMEGRMPCAMLQPMVVMVPVWTFFPMVPGAWVYAR